MRFSYLMSPRCGGMAALVLALGLTAASCSSDSAEADISTPAAPTKSSAKTSTKSSSTASTKSPSASSISSPSATSSASPTPSTSASIKGIDDRTSIAIATDKGLAGTSNADESRPGLSVIKLYIADYALRGGVSSKDEFNENVPLVKRMITGSDDFAADILYNKYPGAIDAVAAEYDLEGTFSNGSWGSAYTSAEDVAKYLFEVKKKRPNSLILKWMEGPQDIAVDGTKQQWGTARLDGVEGTKWGWSDFGKKIVASGSVGDDFAAAAFTWGSADDQNEDIDALASQLKGKVDTLVK